MKTKIIKIALLGVTLIGIAGCGASVFSTRQTNPVVAEYLGVWPFPGAVGVLSPDASRRITLIRMDDAEHNYSDTKWQIGEFCAEPPPDAMVNTASAFATALAAKMNVESPIAAGVTGKDAGSGEGQAQLAQQIASAMSPLLRRSQGLQWGRDNMSAVCNAHLNRVISKAQYKELIDKIMASSFELIKLEIDKLPKLDYTITGGLGNVTLPPIEIKWITAPTDKK
jgi:hypothetical protein